jgi:hypothetical protein
MLARRLTTILPVMTLAEAIETPRIHSVAGLTGHRTAQASDLAGYPTPRTKGEEGAYYREERCPEAEVAQPARPVVAGPAHGRPGRPRVIL